jgi:nicotinamidase-related amidase
MNLTGESKLFLEYLSGWVDDLTPLALEQVVTSPNRTAIVSVDVINGFCYEGPLSSPRVAGIVAPIRSLFVQAWQLGVQNIVLVQDTHEPEAVEFAQWPPHCVRGTSEAETVPEFKTLPFFDQITVFPKNSIQSALNTGLGDWQVAHPQVDTWIVVGDCTDLCTYQLAMHLRLQANAAQATRRVILPANCVDTYDLSIETARSIGALPHPGSLVHAFFLYHMALNGIEVVKEIA